jgi:DNA-binding transcriptional LysR family regulator
VELSALRHFHETVRNGSIRRASEVLHVAPSSISRSIAALEHDLGAPVFERSNRGMRLTPAGEVLASHTSKVFRDIERARSAIDDLRGLRRGRVSLFAPEGLVGGFLPSVLAEFHRLYPAVGFEVSLGSTDRITQAIVTDEADIGITFNREARADVVTVAEYVEPLCCIVAPAHPLARCASVGLADVAGCKLALPTTSFGLRRMVDAAFIAARLQPRAILDTNSLELAKRLAMTGEAVAFMPGFMVQDDIDRGTLVAVALDSSASVQARTSVCVHRDRQLSFASRTMLRLLSDRLEALPPRAG